MKYFIAAPCRHWNASKNRRFRFYRVEDERDGFGRLCGSVWDAQRGIWIEQSWGVDSQTLKREATPAEIQATERLL